MKKLIQNWLGIRKLQADIHNLEGDLMCILERDPKLKKVLKEMEKANENNKPTSRKH